MDFKAAIERKDAVFGWNVTMQSKGSIGPMALDRLSLREDVSRIDVQFQSRAGVIAVCVAGSGVPFDETAARRVLTEDEIDVAVQLNAGDADAVAWGCDLTYDYVKINGDYRT